MTQSWPLVSAFVHGLASGALLVLGLVVVRSGLSRHIRISTALATLSIVGWLINESGPLYTAMGEPAVLYVLATPVGGIFWLWVLTVFADWRVSWLTLAPAIALLVSGVAMSLLVGEPQTLLWGLRNLAGGLLAAHAGILIIRGWDDDLVGLRRRFRAVLFTLACLFVLIEVAVSFGYRLTQDQAWLSIAVGRPLGGLIVALLLMSMAGLTLTVIPATFGAARRPEPATDARGEAIDRELITRLDGLMSSEIWRREGLTIGALARELVVPEHRLRRLINQRLGHRNFADFLNGHRIEAAKRRLADPAEARTTVATIAYDLGFGSLGPFNRAFREATGAAPSDWRRRALADASPKLPDAT